MTISKPAAAGMTVLGGSAAAAGGVLIANNSSSVEKQTISKQLGNKVLKVEDSTEDSKSDKSLWEIKAKLLREYSEPTNNKAFELTEISSTKNQLNGSDSDWSKLRDWCGNIYKKDYSENNEWKLADKFCSKPTIEEALFDTQLSKTETTLNADWDKKVTTAKDQTSGAKDATFKATLNGDSNKTDKSKLQEWCDSQYVKFVGEKVPNGGNEDLLTEVKRLCALTVKEKLDGTVSNETKKPSIQDGSMNTSGTWTKNLEAVKAHKTTSGSTPTLTPTLEEANTDTGNKGWEKLRDWCKETYTKGYKGESNSDWKLADKFCRQNP